MVSVILIARLTWVVIYSCDEIPAWVKCVCHVCEKVRKGVCMCVGVREKGGVRV